MTAASHRSIEASEDEMAYEPPMNVDFGAGFVLRGRKAFQEYRKWRSNFVRIRPELRQAFPNDAAVNEVLELIVKLKQMPLGTAKKRKTA